MTVNQRIKILRKSLDMGQFEFSKSIGIKQPSLSAIENEVTTPSLDTIKNIGVVYNVNSAWLLEGLGEMFKSDQVAEPQAEYKPQGLTNNPKGNIIYKGDFVEAGPEKGYRDIDPDDLQRYSLPGFEHKLYFLYNIRGDSMAGRFPSGNKIIVRPVSHKHYMEWGHPYVVRLKEGEGQLFKRVFEANKEGYVILRSDNDRYKDITIKNDLIDSVYRYEAQIDLNGGLVFFKPEESVPDKRIETVEQKQNKILDELSRLTAQISKIQKAKK